MDIERRELRRGAQEIALAPKAFDVLAYLVGNRDRLVTKQELLDEFWSSQATESVLQTTIRLIRKALDDNGREQRLVKTHFGRGFRFVGTIEDEGTKAASAPSDEAGLPQDSGFRERRMVAAMCCRVESPSKTGASIDPDDQAEIVQRFLDASRDSVAQHEGSRLHEMMNGFTALFGATATYEDGVRRAVFCADELHRSPAARELTSVGLKVSTGIDAGAMTVAEADQTVGQWSPPGSVVETAAALQAQANEGQIILSMAARAQVMAEVETAPLGNAACVLQRIRTVRAGVPSRLDLAPSSFVGRGAELEIMQDRLAQSRMGQGQAVILSGPAGIGKSRLLGEFLAGVSADDACVLSENCLPRLRNTPLTPFAGLMRAVVQSDQSLLEKVAHTKMDKALLADLLGDELQASQGLDALGPQARRRGTFDLVWRVLTALAERSAVIVSIEDMHWMDTTSRECLTYLLERLEDAHLFLVATTRPEGTELVADWLPLTRLALSPLYMRDSIALVRSMPGLGDISDDAATHLAHRAAGNPFFLEELSIAFLADGTQDTGLPHTVQAVLASRFADLAPGARRVLQIASVIGASIPAQVLRRISGLDDAALQQALTTLRQSGFLGELVGHSDADYRFRHVLIQDAIYETLTARDRRVLNRDLALMLEDGVEAPGIARSERLAWHYQEAQMPDKAVKHWQNAARAAYLRSAYEEAIEFARNGLALLDAEPEGDARAERELRLGLILAPALVAARGYGADEVGVAYQRARVLGRRVADPRTIFRILVGLWNFHWVKGDLGRARQLAQDMLELAETENSVTMRMRSHASMGEILFHMGELALALDHLETGIRLYGECDDETAGPRIPAVACFSYAAWAAQLLGRSEDALDHIDRAEKLARRIEQPLSLALCQMFKAELHQLRDDPEACLAAAQEATALSRDHGFPFWLGSSLVVQGWAENRLGDTKFGIATIRQGIGIFEATGARVQLANWNGLLADALFVDGDMTGAQRVVTQALAWAHDTGDCFFAPRIHQVAHRVHTALGQQDEAKRHADLARTMTGQQRARQAPSI